MHTASRSPSFKGREREISETSKAPKQATYPHSLFSFFEDSRSGRVRLSLSLSLSLCVCVSECVCLCVCACVRASVHAS